METFGRIMCGVLVCVSSGCATTSFAPPSVNLENEMMTRGSNRVVQSCRPFERTPAVTIAHDTAGAMALIDNYVLSYRCAAHSAANGRQMFEIPALIAGAGAATALAFGAGTDVAIAGGAATAILNGGKSYYSPQEKAAIFDSALDALLCVKTEAVGVDAYTIKAIADVEKQVDKTVQKAFAATPAVAGGPPPVPSIAVSSDERYFQTVQAALLSVERVLATRLSRVGRFDTAGVIAEIKLLDPKTSPTSSQENAADQSAQALTNGSAATGQVKAVIEGIPADVIARTIVKLDVLQPKLEQCVVRAKI